ncbi:MAG: LysM peptidoglycan-binding domain-containing protein [Pseudomonadota bacterium]
MRAVYWVLAIAALLALVIAAWLAGSLGSTSSDQQGRQSDVEEAAVASIEPEPDVFEEPEIDTPTPPSFDIVRISRNGTGVVAGRALPGQKVELLQGEDVAASAFADDNGEWVIILADRLPGGSLELSLRARGADGQLVTSDNVVVVEIPEESDEGVLAVLSPRTGDGVSRALQIPSGNNAGALILHVSSIDILPDSSAIVTGRSNAGDSLRIYLNNAYVNEVTADDAGAWSISLGALDVSADHELRIDQLAREDSAVTLRIVQPFSKSAPFEPSAAARSVVVSRGNNLWAIARSVYGGGELYTVIFEENAGQIRNPDLIYPGQVFDLPGAAADQAVSPQN